MDVASLHPGAVDANAMQCGHQNARPTAGKAASASPAVQPTRATTADAGGGEHQSLGFGLAQSQRELHYRPNCLESDTVDVDQLKMNDAS